VRHQFSFVWSFQWAEMAVALLAAWPCLAGEAPAPECSYFRGARIISVGGQAEGTPVIPVAVDQLTIDLVQHQACHALHWSIYTVKGLSRDKVCFDIGAAAKDQTVAVSARFPTGVTAKVADLSASADRAIAQDLAQACQARSAGATHSALPGGLDL
jgi:hypothetical protein